MLVKLYNVTQQKEMEAELQLQKEALARWIIHDLSVLSAATHVTKVCHDYSLSRNIHTTVSHAFKSMNMV